MKKVLSFILVLSMVLGSFGMAFAAPANSGNAAVDKMVELGFVTGDEGGLRLNDTIKRSEVAAIVTRVLGLEEVAKASNWQGQFADVTPAHWANGNINIAAGRALVNGYPDGTFAPDNTITNAEAVTIMVRMLLDAKQLEDLNKIGAWPGNYLAKATELGILEGVNIANYAEPATRETVFTLAFNAYETTVEQTLTGAQALVVENYRTESIAKDEIVVEIIKEVQDAEFAEIGDEYAIKVDENTDVEYLLGKVLDVKFDTKGNIVGFSVNEDYKYVSGKVELAKDSLKVDGTKYTVDKNERKTSNDERFFQAYLNNKDFTYEGLVKEVKSETLEFARVTIKNGKVLFIDGFNFEDIAPVAKAIDGKDKVAFYNDNEDGEVKTITVDKDVFVIYYVDGEFQVGNHKDIEAKDVAHWTVDKKGNVETMIVRPEADSIVEGEYEKANASKAKGEEDTVIKITIDGKDYSANVADKHRDAVYSTLASGQDFLRISDDYRRELEVFKKTDVVVLRDILGNVQLLASETEDGTFYGLVLQALNNEFKLLRADGETEYYTVTIRDTKFSVENRNGKTEEAKKADFEIGSLVKVTAKEDLITEMVLLEEPAAKVVDKVTKDLITINNVTEYTGKSTVVFVRNGSSSKAMTIADFLKNYKYPNATAADNKDAKLEAFTVLGAPDRRVDQEKNLDVIVFTNAQLQKGTYDEKVVEVDRVFFTGKGTSEVIELRVVTPDGDKVTYEVTSTDAKNYVKDNKVVAGSIATISLTKTDTPEIKEIKEEIAPSKVATYKVVSRSGNIVVLDVDGEDVTYRLAANASVFGNLVKGEYVSIVADEDTLVIKIADVRAKYDAGKVEYEKGAYRLEAIDTKNSEVYINGEWQKFVGNIDGLVKGEYYIITKVGNRIELTKAKVIGGETPVDPEKPEEITGKLDTTMYGDFLVVGLKAGDNVSVVSINNKTISADDFAVEDNVLRVAGVKVADTVKVTVNGVEKTVKF